MKVNIVGIRGLPAAHGGFETFAAKLAPYLIERGYEVTVYCQEDEGRYERWEDIWEGIRRVHIRPKMKGPMGTIEFDLKCILDVLKDKNSVDLVLGYNTGIFTILQRLKARKVATNMDGIEWKRAKWNLLAKTWFYINEVFASNLCSIPIADHPEIASHVDKRSLKKCVMIPYGADEISEADASLLKDLNIEVGKYFVSIARIEPENSILEIVKAFSSVQISGKLLVLGRFDIDNKYHMSVKQAAGENVIFAGAIYQHDILAAIRYFARAYIHGHQVGGTNPSLVEALGASSAIIAHNNPFNKWVCGNKQFFFDDIESLKNLIVILWENNNLVLAAKKRAYQRFSCSFRWDSILKDYERILCDLNNRK